MRHSFQTLAGFLAVLSIFSVQVKDIHHGTRQSYTRAVNDVGSDDGIIFDTSTSTTLCLRRREGTRKASHKR